MACSSHLSINPSSDLTTQLGKFYTFLEKLKTMDCSCISERIDQLLGIARNLKDKVIPEKNRIHHGFISRLSSRLSLQDPSKKLYNNAKILTNYANNIKLIKRNKNKYRSLDNFIMKKLHNPISIAGRRIKECKHK